MTEGRQNRLADIALIAERKQKKIIVFAEIAGNVSQIKRNFSKKLWFFAGYSCIQRVFCL